jgi:hypothetical protein
MAGTPSSHSHSQKAVKARRQSVWVMLTKGMQQKDIAKSLNVSEATITLDVKALENNSDQFLNDLAKKTLPFFYEKSIDGLTRVLEESWKIINDTEDKWQKLSALKLAKECDESLMKLFIEGPTVAAVRKVKDQLNEVNNFATNGNKVSSQGV